MATTLAKLLRESPFVTIDEARDFALWYDTHEHHTNWDDERYSYAAEIIRLAERERQ